MITERQHWLSITDDPGWKRDFIADPNISLTATVDAIVSACPKDPKRIVEIGCGYGRLTREIRTRFPEAAVWGVDVNPTVLKEARKYDPETYITQAHDVLSKGGVLRVQFIEGDRNVYLDHWVSAELMVLWAHDAGYTKTTMTRGLAHPDWCWLTCIK